MTTNIVLVICSVLENIILFYVNYCNNITDEEKEERDQKYDPSNFFLKNYKYGES